jgi:hypothetical protein
VVTYLQLSSLGVESNALHGTTLEAVYKRPVAKFYGVIVQRQMLLEIVLRGDALSIPHDAVTYCGVRFNINGYWVRTPHFGPGHGLHLLTLLIPKVPAVKMSTISAASPKAKQNTSVSLERCIWCLVSNTLVPIFLPIIAPKLHVSPGY